MKFIKLLLVMFVLEIMFGNILIVHAETLDDNIGCVFQLRAGGGRGVTGGTGGSGGRGRTYGNNNGVYCNHHNVLLCLFDRIGSILFIFSTTCIGACIIYIKVLRSSFNSKKYIKLISKKDKMWDYKNIEIQVIDTYYVVQKAWTSMNIELAKEYMDDDLYELFRQKIEWMEIGNKRNILKRIKLIDLKPVSVYDDDNDKEDLVWFYIKGSMIDYVIDTETNEIIDGRKTIFGIPFVEYWKFVRKDNKWVLTKILQENERDKIIFQ